jgi:hypothetical protein
MRVPPTRLKLWSVSTRRIRAWVATGMSAISSRNKRAAMRLLEQAGTHEIPPSSTPNNSSSTRSGIIRAALTITKGAVVRWLQPCSSRAATSLPTPGPPVISTRLPVEATRLSVARTELIDAGTAGQVVLAADRGAERFDFPA